MAGFLVTWVVGTGAVLAGDLFDGTNLLRLSLRLDAAGMEILRHRSDESGERARARAVVTEGGNVYSNVSVQLKGFSSFRTIDDRPSLTLKFDRYVRDQRFHGLDKISLNNSLQDPSRLHEVWARELLAAAGVPVPRATHAVVELNGRELGLYVVTEGFDRRFLARHFGPAAGVLYEGGTLRDIDARPRIATGAEPPGEPSPLSRLIAAARNPDPAERYDALARLLDLDPFLSMLAMETILCHSDSYSMNRNNYRVHYSPVTERFTFVAHGLDRILGEHRSGLDLSIVPPQLGLVSRALLSTVPGRRQYLARLESLATNLFNPQRLGERARQIDARLQAGKQDPTAVWPAQRSGRNEVKELCGKIERRAADLAAQLATLRDRLGAPQYPKFDPAGRCSLDDWALRRFPGRPAAAVEQQDGDNGPRVIARSPASTSGPFSFTLVRRLTLPAGRYMLRGGWRVAPGVAPLEGSAYLQRCARERFQFRREGLDWRAFDEEIVVTPNFAPEEIDVICEFRSPDPEVKLDPGNIQLIVQP